MGMRWYVTRRLAWTLVVAFIIVSVIWALFKLAPNQEVVQAGQQAAISGENATAAQERIRQIEGLNRPLWEQYTGYIVNVFTFDWGWSDSRAQPVVTALVNSLYWTAQYSVPWTIFTVLFGTGAGLYSAANQYSWKDNFATFLAFFGLSIPNFWFAIMLLLVFGIHLGWFPIVFNPDVAVFSLENVRQLILPIFVLVTGSIATIHRVSRNETAEYLNADFVKTAKAKGATSRRILARHILRPASVPMSTTYVATLLALFYGSSVVVEVVFSIPGLGRTTLSAIQSQDVPLVLGAFFMYTIIGVIGNLLQDIVYTVLDPRIDFSDR
jgi:peptide/nickel transport system permease protein